MSSDWHSNVLKNIENAHWGLRQAKASTDYDSRYQTELKYTLRGFQHANALSQETPPRAGETQLMYLERVVLVIAVVPAHVASVDRESWLNGTRQLVRALSVGTDFRYEPLEVQPQRRRPSLTSGISDALRKLLLVARPRGLSAPDSDMHN